MTHYLITTLAVLATLALAGWIFCMLVKRYFDNEQKERLLEMKIDERQETLRAVTPIRLQAYERMALFLERISPDSLVLRCWKPGMDLRTLQGSMTKTIRDEWEHNLSQQVYLSTDLWTRIREAKDDFDNYPYYDIVGQFSPELWEGTDRIINTLEQSPTTSKESITVGTKVHHPIFGDGEVIQEDPDYGTVTVQFKDFGKRRLKSENLIFAE